MVKTVEESDHVDDEDDNRSIDDTEFEGNLVQGVSIAQF
jgi:hypothetical protein